MGGSFIIIIVSLLVFRLYNTEPRQSTQLFKHQLLFTRKTPEHLGARRGHGPTCTAFLTASGSTAAQEESDTEDATGTAGWEGRAGLAADFLKIIVIYIIISLIRQKGCNHGNRHSHRGHVQATQLFIYFYSHKHSRFNLLGTVHASKAFSRSSYTCK